MSQTHEEFVHKQSRAIGIPFKSFLYTFEQVSDMLSIDLKTFQQKYVHYDNRTPGRKKVDTFLARDISPLGEKPEWRIADTEVLRWSKAKGFKIVERGWIVA